jgi:polysaccharide biosynthesis protein PslG
VSRRRRQLRLAALLTAAGVALILAAAVVLGLSSGSHSDLLVPRPRQRLGPPPHLRPPVRPRPRPARAAPATQQFGANVNLLFDTLSTPVPTLYRQMRALRATGATLARSDALWEATEPTAPVNGVHHYNWAFDDRVATLLAVTGLRWLPVLDYTAPWDQSVPDQDHSPPRSIGAYADYAGAFAARYGLAGSFWRAHPQLHAEPVQTFEIWNEPDNAQFWSPTPRPGQYAALYTAARNAIDAVDPQAWVIIGGLERPTSYLPELLAADPGLRGHVDGVAVHPYGTPAVTTAKVAAVRVTLGRLGMARVPLYVTEFGWSTSPAGTPEYAPAAIRPHYILRTMTVLERTRCRVAEGILYTWYSARADPADEQQWYGVSGPAATPTPDTRAFALGIRRSGLAARGLLLPCR